MIKLLNGNLPPEGGFNPFIYTKIAASLTAYGDKYPFLSFWTQGNETKTAIICKQDSTVFVTATRNADFSEISNFLAVISYNSLQTEESTAKALGLEGISFTLLKLINPAPCPYLPICKVSIKEVYQILFEKENRDITSTDFDSFYADLSHRIRHLTAYGVIGENSAVAVASHIHNESAVISGVATFRKKQGLGLGSAAVSELIKNLPKHIYTAALDAVDFYLKLGFKPIDKISVINQRK